MERQVKQRVVGAAVLVVLAVVFIPLFLDTGGIDTVVPEIEAVPPPPTDDFDARIVPLSEQDVARLEEEAATPLPPPPMVRTEEVTVAAPPPSDDGETQTDAVAVSAEPPLTAGTDDADPLATLSGPREEIESWTVQLGSFGDQGNARRLIERLREKTWPAYLERREENGKTVFKVRVGPQISRSKAEQVRRELEQGFALKGILVRYR